MRSCTVAICFAWTLLCTPYAMAQDATVLVCYFEGQPPITLTYRGGVGADDNTMSVGGAEPVQLFEGSRLSSSGFEGKDYTFSFGRPTSLSINSDTFYGECGDKDYVPEVKPAPLATTASAWEYHDRVDQMRGTTTHFATLLSETVLDFDFPYNGGTQPYLWVRQTDGVDEIMLVVDKGQFSCDAAEPSKIFVKFDAGPVEEFNCFPAANGMSGSVFVGPSGSFLWELKGASTLIVEAPFYQSGPKQMTFKTGGLKW